MLHDVAHALLRAVSRLISTPLCPDNGVDTSVDTARKSACATFRRNKAATTCR
jgi:hypothetical protein